MNFLAEVATEGPKRCPLCDRLKARSEFYRSRTSRDGLRSYCKDCGLEQGRLWRQANPEPHRERARAVRQRSGGTRLKDKTYKQGNRQKIYAQKKLQHAVRTGRMTRPDSCERCGADRFAIQAHHEDYDAPLTVEWLCAPCHGAVHSNLRTAA